MLSLLVLCCITSSLAAPTEGPVRIDLPISGPGFLSGVNQKVNTLSNVAFQNAAAINGLIGQNAALAKDAVTSGITATTGFVGDRISSASTSIVNNVQQAGMLASLAGSMLYGVASTGANALYGGAVSGGRSVFNGAQMGANALIGGAQTVYSGARTGANALVGGATAGASALMSGAASGAKALYDGAQVGINTKVAVLRSAGDALNNIVPTVGIFAEQPRKVNKAILETESLPSRIMSAKENSQQVFANIFNPKPIVDTITEEEKYGNEGGKLDGLGRALVTGYETTSGIVSNALNVPFNLFKSFTRSASASLNNLGSRLIGL